MAASRGTLLFFCLATVAVLLLFFVYAAHSFHESEFSEIHAVRHHGPCKGGLDAAKGEQCHDDAENEDDDEDVNEDVDETYKIVNKVKVSLSHMTKPNYEEASLGDDAPDLDADQFNVLGH